MDDMKRLMGSSAVIFFLLALVVSTGCEKKDGSVAGDDRIPDWKMSSTYATSLPILGNSAVYFVEQVNQLSNGILKIELSEPDQLVPALEVLQATGEGRIDAAWSSSGFWIDKLPAAAFFSSVPFGPDTTEYLAWLYQGEGLALWRELYASQNVLPIPCAVVPPEAAGWFRQPITSLEQFRGMKIRFGGIGGLVMQKLGANVQNLSGGDVFTALERGLVDAAEFSLPSIDQKLEFHRITRHYYFPGWHQQASLLELIINKDRWAALPQSTQALIELTCRANITRTLAEGEHSQQAAIAQLSGTPVQIHYWPDEMLNGFRDAYAEVVKELSASDKNFRRVEQSFSNYRKAYREWARLSRLPGK